MTDPIVLVHHGIKGQKWGVRRFQNEDGTRTSAGLAHDRKLYAEERDEEKQRQRNDSKRRGLTDNQKQALKTAGKIALGAATVAGAAYLYSQNKSEIDSLIHQTKAQLAFKFPTEIEASGRSFVQDCFHDAKLSVDKKSYNRQRREETINKINRIGIEAATNVSGKAKGVVDAIKDTTSNAGKTVRNTVTETSAKAKESSSNAKEAVKRTANNAGSALKDLAKSADEKATMYLATQAYDVVSKRRQEAKEEKNRHKEEMTRLRRGG